MADKILLVNSSGNAAAYDKDVYEKSSHYFAITGFYPATKEQQAAYNAQLKAETKEVAKEAKAIEPTKKTVETKDSKVKSK